MKMSRRLVAEQAFVQGFLGSDVICEECGATLATYGSACTADLSDICHGFQIIEKVKAAFNAAYDEPLPAAPEAQPKEKNRGT
jgi:hypothetical protein